MDLGISGKLFNPIFKQIRAATGGHVKLAVCGGAPLAKDTQKFLSVTHAPLLVGYGLTETSAYISFRLKLTIRMAAISTPETLEYGAVGVPTSSVEIKLVDVPEMGYLHSNKNPQGEIWLRGPTVAMGYYANPDETNKSFTSDGWFKTGDVGQWQPSGTLLIVDRIKNLVKTLNGEYIALEKVFPFHVIIDPSSSSRHIVRPSWWIMLASTHSLRKRSPSPSLFQMRKLFAMSLRNEKLQISMLISQS